MAFKHYELTLTGAAQRLSSVLANVAVGGPDDKPLAFVTLQLAADASGACFVGDVDVSATSWGQRIPVPVSSIPAPPLYLEAGYGAAIKLSDVYVFGTANDVLHIGTLEK